MERINATCQHADDRVWSQSVKGYLGNGLVAGDFGDNLKEPPVVVGENKPEELCASGVGLCTHSGTFSTPIAVHGSRWEGGNNVRLPG